MTSSVIQATFSAGEWATQLYGRVDVAKYKAAAGRMRNFYVDYRGGASLRPGTRFLMTAQDSSNPVRLIPFQASTEVGYVLEFGQNYIRVIGNSVALTSIGSPYAGSEVFQIKYSQLVDKLILCHPNHPPQELKIISPAVWTLTAITFGTTVGLPTGLGNVVINPGTSFWAYAVTAVDDNGQESQRSIATQAGINAVPGQSSVQLTWTAPAGPTPTSYNVYRTTNSLNVAVPAGAAFGYVTTVTSINYTDVIVNNQPQVPSDFSITPPIHKDPTTNPSGNPTVPGFFQQRMVLAAKPTAVSTFDMSQVGEYYNFDVSDPIQPDNAINGTLSSGKLNRIVSMANVPQGLLLLTDQSNWLVTSGSGGAGISPIDISAHEHSHNGASDLPPLLANFDVLFVQAKNSVVRDLTFQWTTQIYTGTDISILSSHLFFGRTIKDWAWAEEQWKQVWAVRNDGILLSCTFLKEQELIGWSWHDTQGTFESVCTITEPIAGFSDPGLSDTVYVVVNRSGVRNIEKINTRFFFDDAADAWFVDAAAKYTGSPTTTPGALWNHLSGMVCTGLADGLVIPPFTMPGGGSPTLSAPASKVIIGLAYTGQLQTLPLDIGDPTIQGKRKAIGGVTVRVVQTLGLSIGKDFDGSQVPMKDLVRGNVGTQTNEVVNGLVTGDARTIIDPSWDEPGQYSIQQSYPLPATVLAVIPEIELGDTSK